MSEMKPWPMLLVMALSLMSAVGRSDQRGGEGAVPDMLAGVLANAQVDLAPASLIHALATHSESLIRALAADALGLLGERSAEAPLFRALSVDSDRQVREASALALARIGNATGTTALKGFMRSSDSSVRRLTMAAQLAELGEPDGFSFVAEAATSKQASTRSLAAQFLAPFVPLAGLTDGSGRSPGEILLALAGDESAEVRLTVVNSLPAAILKGLDLESARAVTKRLAEQDLDPSVRDSAKSLLEAWRFDEEERVRRKAGV